MKTILIADDEESLRTLIETTLEAPGLRILHAANGEQAVELARAEHPDLILLDWMMPGRTGIEVAETLRGEPSTADIAILMLTGRDREKDRQRGLALGIGAYLVKPFSPLQLLECVRRALTASEGRNKVHEQMQRG
ncbi:MAG TPA: response regulator [Terriglobales bacterium]|jgi:two-component system phosphate regulon response regulator PhoB|nr:response regulator [Terriglobales bacterium]